MSRGLFKYRNYYFHFVFSDFKQKREFGVEVYDSKLNPLGYTGIASIPITNEEGNLLQWFVDDMDKEGNIYIRSCNKGGSQIRIYQVDHQDLNKL